MYFELEDFRPDTPRTPSVISRREAVLISLVAHLVAVIAYLLMPKGFFDPAPVPYRPPEQEAIRYVHMAPALDKSQAPKLPAEQSDMDRRSATKEQAPKPQNTMPFSRGDTPEKTEGAKAVEE